MGQPVLKTSSQQEVTDLCDVAFLLETFLSVHTWLCRSSTVKTKSEQLTGKK